MLAWLKALWDWLCAQWSWLFAKRVRLNNSSVDVGPVLAEGGFATVYEAVDVRTKRAIAIKQIRCPDAFSISSALGCFWFLVVQPAL